MSHKVYDSVAEFAGQLHREYTEIITRRNRQMISLDDAARIYELGLAHGRRLEMASQEAERVKNT